MSLPVFSETRFASEFATALAMSVLPHPGRAVEEDPLRRLQLVLVEQVGVEVRQLDGVLDLVDLVVETADVFVGDVGDLFEDELLDLGPGQALDEQARPRLHEQVVAGAHLHARQLLAQLADALFVGPADDEGPGAALHELLEDHDLTGDLRAAGEDHVEGFVEHDLLARAAAR